MTMTGEGRARVDDFLGARIGFDDLYRWALTYGFGANQIQDDESMSISEFVLARQHLMDIGDADIFQVFSDIHRERERANE